MVGERNINRPLIYSSWGYSSSRRATPSSWRRLSRASRYCLYCSWFSTLALTPVDVNRLAPIHDTTLTAERIAHTLKNADGGGVVVDAASGLQGGGKDLDGGNEIVSEAVVQVTLSVKRVSKLIDDVEIANDSRAYIA